MSYKANPILLEIVEGTIESSRKEMELQVERTARSTIIREQHDYRAAIFDRHGRGISAVSSAANVQPILKDFVKDIEVGDLFIWNDPYKGGGISHLPDICVTAPVLWQDRFIAFIQVYGHVHDVGGAKPGSMSLDATDIFQEGFIIPPVKLYQGGQRNQALYQTILNNSRYPEMLQGDLDAEIAACQIGVQRVTALIQRYGLKAVEECFDLLLARCSHTLKDQVLPQIPDGEYSFEDFIETAGMSPKETLEFARMKVTLRKNFESIIFDFEGTADQVNVSINCPANGEYYVKYLSCILRLLAPEIVMNDGQKEVLSAIIPEGTILNPVFPASCSNRHWTIFRLTEVCMGALVKAMAGGGTGSSDTRCSVAFVARDPEGQQFLIRDVMGAGSGARPHADGDDCVTANVRGRNLPCEFFEAFYPVRVEKLAIRKDSGGVGQFRGGLGYLKEIRFLADGFIMIHDDRMLLQPFGSAGGQAGAGSLYILNPDTEKELPSATKTDFMPIKSGDLLRVLTPGGGGWGDPLNRDPESVLQDFQLGRVSLDSACRDYGVVIDPDSNELLLNKTSQQRTKLRDSRAPLKMIDRGKRFKNLLSQERIALTLEDSPL
ncbi:MAG: hydantoinase B/oxoprolinase family protein [Acidobacteriota bacterium]|nr:hydantoinase B/oxoprolinase family protein [Acidobacteriota bacterium]